VWRDALLVASKDLRIEARSRVATNQIAPYALVVLLLFGFAFDKNQTLLTEAAPGLFWVAVLLCTLLAVQRSFAVEVADGARDGLRLSGLDPAGIFLGKGAAVCAQLFALEALLVAGIVILFGTHLADVGLLIATAGVATIGLAAAGTVYGVMAAGLRVRETLLPLLILPVVAPVMLGATQAWEYALGQGTSASGGKWLVLLISFAVIYVTLGVLAFGALLEEA
jgi:heme exporter protein B